MKHFESDRFSFNKLSDRVDVIDILMNLNQIEKSIWITNNMTSIEWDERKQHKKWIIKTTLQMTSWSDTINYLISNNN